MGVEAGAQPRSDAKLRIVILGGSYGGISVAHYALKHVVSKLPGKDEAEIVLVNPSRVVYARPASPRALLSGDLLPLDKLFVDIPALFEQYPANSFRFILGAASALDAEARVVTIQPPTPGAAGIAVGFDALVIATGASTPSPLLGVNRDAAFLREAWSKFRAALPEAKRIVIAGGGPSSVETAAELGEHLNERPRRGWFTGARDNPAPEVKITIVTAGERILPLLRSSIADEAETELAKFGVSVVKNTRVVSVFPEGAGTSDEVAARATLTLDNGTTMEADLYIPATGTVPNTSFIDKTFLTPGGLVRTNAATMRADSIGPRVYALGDASSAARPAVHIVLEQVPVLCANMKRDMLSLGGVEAAGAAVRDREFKEDKREAQLVVIGRSGGVGAAMGYRVPSFLVWLIKGRDYWLWTLGRLWSGKQWAKES